MPHSLDRQSVAKHCCLAICLGVLIVTYVSCANAMCGCYACLTGCSHGIYGSLGEEEVPYSEFRIEDSWERTATNGSAPGPQGDPLSLTWGIVDDGTSISGSEGTSDSDLITTLNSEYGAGTGGIEEAPWFRFFEESFGRWAELSGITFNYEPNDGGAAIDNTTTPRGELGVYADIRIGGHSIDGSSGSNTLAYNYYPDHGDMVIDTDNASYFGNTNQDSLQFRNTLMHEIGHGIGLNHLDSDDSGQLMEPFISTSFDGPQIDDILAAQRNYGDVYEKNGGNDDSGTAEEIGLLVGSDSWSVGADGASTVVSPDQTDFISIDGGGDEDWFEFSVSATSMADIVLTQVGATYDEGPQDGTQSELDNSTRNPLTIELFDDGSENAIPVAVGSTDGSGLIHSISDFEVSPGQGYYLKVTGSVDDVQLYQLDLEVEGSAGELGNGDYNSDGVVDMTDYIIWGTFFGAFPGALPDGINPDGNGDGVIDAADYVVWRDNYAQTGTAVPEPAGATVLALGAALALMMRVDDRRRGAA